MLPGLISIFADRNSNGIKHTHIMKYLMAAILLLTVLLTKAQALYTSTYGNSTSKPVIFIHGGPGSSSVAFEVSTAQKLADQGFYVILYDRRGEGHSRDLKATYTFQKTFDDLNDI
jgi:proline iminopeptidase